MTSEERAEKKRVQNRLLSAVIKCTEAATAVLNSSNFAEHEATIKYWEKINRRVERIQQTLAGYEED